MRKILLLSTLSSIAILYGCETLTPEEIQAQNVARCQSYGFQLGTEPMASCMMDIDMQNRKEAHARQIATQERMQREMHHQRMMAANQGKPDDKKHPPFMPMHNVHPRPMVFQHQVYFDN